MEMRYRRTIETALGVIDVIALLPREALGVMSGGFTWHVSLRELDDVIEYFAQALVSPSLDRAPLRTCDHDLVMAPGADGSRFWISSGCCHLALDRETAGLLLSSMSEARRALRDFARPKEVPACSTA